MSIDEVARRAADDLSGATGATLDTVDMLGRIEPASRRRSRLQQAGALALVAGLVTVGALVVRGQLVAAPEPVVTPKPSPTGAAAGLVAGAPVIRADRAHHSATIVIPIRNEGHRAVYPSVTMAQIRGATLRGTVTTQAFSDVLLTGSKEAIAFGENSVRTKVQVMEPGGTYAWALELKADCRVPIAVDNEWYFENPSPLYLMVTYDISHFDEIGATTVWDAFPTPNPKDPMSLTPPHPGWTLPGWVFDAGAAACGTPSSNG